MIGTKEADLVTAVLLYAMRCLAEGDQYALRGMRFGPQEVEALFCGGITQTCWAVTRSNGAYRVIWVPSAEVFSLAVESKYGPVDIGVHGDAVAVYGSIH